MDKALAPQYSSVRYAFCNRINRFYNQFDDETKQIAAWDLAADNGVFVADS